LEMRKESTESNENGRGKECIGNQSRQKEFKMREKVEGQKNSLLTYFRTPVVPRECQSLLKIRRRGGYIEDLERQ